MFFVGLGLGTYPLDAPRRSTGSALTAGPFWQTAPKGTKKALPQRSAIAALRFPPSGSAPWARRDGPSMAQHGSPGFLPGGPLRKTYTRPAEGAYRSKAKQSQNAVRFGSKKLTVAAQCSRRLKSPFPAGRMKSLRRGKPGRSRVSAVGHGCPHGAAHGAAME